MSFNQADKSILLNYLNRANDLKVDKKIGFNNFTKNVQLPCACVLDVHDIKSLQAVMRKIYELNSSKSPKERIIVRAAAGGKHDEYSESYSLTPGSEADIVIRLVGNEFNEIKPTEQKNVVNVGASVEIGELDNTLYEKFNLSLPTSSLIPYVTVAGLTANAGHGTGKDQPSFSGLIRAITFCLPNGEIVRIDKSHKDFETIRAAHLGLFGIVLNVEMECTEAKKLQCVMEARSIPELIDEIKSGLLINDPYVSIMYVPTYKADELTNREHKNVIVYRWRPVDKAVNDVNSNPSLSRFVQGLEVKLQEDFHLSDLMTAEPSLIPSYMMYVVSKLQVGKKDGISVGPWPTIHYQTAFPRKINDMDYLFEVDQNGKEVIMAIEKLVATLTDFAKNKRKYPVNYAAYLRFIRGTNGGLSTSVHQDNHYVCGFDIVSTPGITGYNEFRDEMSKFFIHNLRAKPHWGKYLPEGLDYEKIYGKDFTEFVDAMKNWYEENHLDLADSMLLNPFFCKILKLPYAPNLQSQQVSATTKTSRCPCAKEMAINAIPYIEEECTEADNLRKQLQMIAANKMSESKQTMFKPQSTVNRKEESDKIKRRKCCLMS